MRPHKTGVAMALLGLVALVACSPGPARPDPARGTLVITTGSPRGVYYAWALSLASQLRTTNPELKVTVEASSGSLRNLQRLTDGTTDLACDDNAPPSFIYGVASASSVPAGRYFIVVDSNTSFGGSTAYELHVTGTLVKEGQVDLTLTCNPDNGATGSLRGAPARNTRDVDSSKPTHRQISRCVYLP